MENYRLEKQELATAVVDAATYVLQDILTYRPTRGQIQIIPHKYTRDDITVITRLSGDLTGELFFGLTFATARGIASGMLRREVDKLSPLEVSALAELGSLITDNALAILEEQGAICYATWPSVIFGQDERATPFAVPCLTVPLRLIVGEINLNVMLESYAPFSWATPQARMPQSPVVQIPAASGKPGGDENLPMAA